MQLAVNEDVACQTSQTWFKLLFKCENILFPPPKVCIGYFLENQIKLMNRITSRVSNTVNR